MNKIDPETIERIRALRAQSKTYEEITNEVGVGYATVYKYASSVPGPTRASRSEPSVRALALSPDSDGSTFTGPRDERTWVAQQRADAIRRGMKNYADTLRLIQMAWQHRDWQVLGYDTWEAYVAGEFATNRVKLTVDERQQAVRALRLDSQMSTRAIARTLGIGQTTVISDLRGVAEPEHVVALNGDRHPPDKPALRRRHALGESEREHRARRHREQTVYRSVSRIIERLGAEGGLDAAQASADKVPELTRSELRRAAGYLLALAERWPR